MTLVEIGAVLLVLMFVLLAAGVWIGMTLAIIGGVGMVWFTTLSVGVTAKNLFTAFWNANASWELAALPLFIWMGEILFRTRLSEQMFSGLAPWLNRVPGRLMHTTILGCGIFGSVSGSSAATCATISKVALPELLRRGYDERIALGSLATAGTLGILIPPSITMVVYAVAAEASIIRIFLAGFLPGLLLMVLFSGYIAWWAWRHPELQPPPEPPTTLAEKLRRSGHLIPCMLLIVFIVIVLVAGWATATECAADGVLGIADPRLDRRLARPPVVHRQPHGRDARLVHDHVHPRRRQVPVDDDGLHRHTAGTRRMGRGARASALRSDRGAVRRLYHPGIALDGISMIVLTSAVVLPMIQKAGFDLIWFGIFIVLLVEIAEVTPPVGFNLFVLQNMTGRDSNTIARMSLPFFVLLIVCIALITAFPEIATWLPDAVMGVDK